MSARHWIYRPTDAEREDLLKALAENPEFPSAAQFIHEGVLRLIHSENINRRYSEVEGLIEELRELKQRFIGLVISHSRSDTE